MGDVMMTKMTTTTTTRPIRLRPSALGLLAALALAGCATSTTKPVADSATADAQQCKASGGFLDQRGRRGTTMCVHRFAGAGKSCASDSDCEGRCLAVRKDGGLPSAGDASPRQCQPDDKLFGCHAMLENGKVASTICID